MTRYLFGLLFCIALFACGQRNRISPATIKGFTSNNGMDTISKTGAKSDTGNIAILPFNKTNAWMLKGATELKLTTEDLDSIERLLTDCLKAHNATQDSTKQNSAYIFLNSYKRQYLPFVTKTGDKKVLINCFCISDWDFEHWKRYLVQVDDGGSCFFHLYVNLSRHTYEQLFINGEG